MSRTRRILGGASIGYLHQAAVIVLGIWLTPFLLRRVGQHEYGLWLVAGQLLGYLALLDLGVLAILPREVAALSGQADKARARVAIADLLARIRGIVRTWQLPGLSVACALIWWFLPSDWSDLSRPLIPVFVAFVALYPLRILLAALQGVQEMTFLAGAQMAGWALGTATTITLIVAGAGLYALVIGWVVTTAVPAGAAWWRSRSLWPAADRSVPAGPTSEIFRSSLWLSAGQVAQVLLAGSDVLLVGRILGAAAVVPYACTGKLVTVFANHPHLLMHVAQPALAEMRASESRDRLRHVATALTQAMLIMSGALIVVILPLNHVFVTWWVGPSQYAGWQLTLGFAVMMVLRHVTVALVYTLFCFGYERQISLTSLADGVVTVVATAILVWTWGPIGAPVGSIIGALLVSVPVNGRSMAREMELSAGAFAGLLAPLLFRIVGVSAAMALISWWLAPTSIQHVALLLTLSIGLYSLMVLPVAWRGPVGPYLRLALHLTRRTVDTSPATLPTDVQVLGTDAKVEAGRP